MKTICLSGVIRDAMLIVEFPSGVEYRNDAGGASAHAPSMEGILVPLNLNLEAVERARDGADDGEITDRIADTVDVVLAADPTTRFLHMNRSRLKESSFGWIHVVINSPDTTVMDSYPDYFGPIYGFGTASGVVTWQYQRNKP